MSDGDLHADIVEAMDIVRDLAAATRIVEIAGVQRRAREWVDKEGDNPKETTA